MDRMEWVIKSESDTDRVWKQIDENGNETGEFRYDVVADGLVSTTRDVIVARPSRSKLALFAAAGAAVPVAVYAVSRLVG